MADSFEIITPMHGCTYPGCPDADKPVCYDDEPYCFKHSPDEGSSVMGYSFKAQGAQLPDNIVAYQRTLDSGVVVETDINNGIVELRLIHPDRTAEWVISMAEASALLEGLTAVVD